MIKLIIAALAVVALSACTTMDKGEEQGGGERVGGLAPAEDAAPAK